VIGERSWKVLVRILALLALAVPALTVSAPKPEPNLEWLIPTLLLLAVPLFLPTRLWILKLSIALPLTLLLMIVGSQLPSTIVVLGFVLAEIAVERSTRVLAWSASISIIAVGATSLIVGDADSLRPLWLVHGIGIGIFLALGIAIRERRALVAETKRSLEMAETAHQVQLAEAIAQERLNISRELHNRLGHQLTVISLNTEVAKQAKAVSKELRSSLEVIGQSARHSLDEISTYLESLRDKQEPEHHSDMLAVKFEKFRALGLEINASAVLLPPTEKLELLAFVDHALDELLMNALKYGKGSIEYQQTFKANTLVITLVNESNPKKSAPSIGGFGLNDIADRASQLGAWFESETSSEGLFQASLTLHGWG
jgi:signal transduction histidine kinase